MNFHDINLQKQFTDIIVPFIDLHHNAKSSSQEWQSVVNGQSVCSSLEDWKDAYDKHLENDKSIYSCVHQHTTVHSL